MVCSKDFENINIKTNDNALKEVPKFKYVGSIITEDEENKEDTIQRIEEIKLCFMTISSKTISMAMWGNHIQRVKIVINNNIIEQVTDFKYLG